MGAPTKEEIATVVRRFAERIELGEVDVLSFGMALADDPSVRILSFEVTEKGAAPSPLVFEVPTPFNLVVDVDVTTGVIISEKKDTK